MEYKTKQQFKMLVLAVLISALMACAGVGSINGNMIPGGIYSDVKLPGQASTNAGSKTGTACANSILGWIARGDASIDAAKQAGGITKVSSVDHSVENILGFYATYCTTVKGE